jgi:predicted dehydrogenase
MKPVKIGLLGLGNMGQNHLRILSMLKDIELSFIFDTDIGKCTQLSKEYKVPISNDIISDYTKIDALVIATPTLTHCDYVKQASEFVKYFFVEKPLADTFSRAEEILGLTKEYGLQIQVGFIERYNPAIVALREVLSQSKKVLNIDFTRTNKLSSRITDVDVIMDLMIHDIDLAMFLNGPVRKINSYGITEDGMISFGRTFLEHVNGVYSSLTASRITEKKIRQVTATCEDMFIDCNLLSKEILINKQTVVDQYFDNIFIASKEEAIGLQQQETLLNQHLSFVEFCRGHNDKSIPTGEDGANAIAIAETIQKQIQGKTT